MCTEKRAYDYQAKGINIVPQLKSKKTVTGWKAYQTAKQSKRDVANIINKFSKASNGHMNIAGIAGKISNIVVVDLDNDAAIEWMKDKNTGITPTVKSNKGYHIYFKYPKNREIPTIQDVLGSRLDDNSGWDDTVPRIDIVSDKHLITLPPSIHQSGKQYKWIKDRSIFDIDTVELPEVFLQAIDNYKRLKAEKDYNTIARTNTREFPTTEMIKQNVNIMDVINRLTIPLREIQESDDHIKVLCPFHPEKTPSFAIYKSTNSYNCFGCGVNGDIFSLVQLWMNNDFKDAVNWISREFNLVEFNGAFSNIKIDDIEPKQIIEDKFKLGAVICDNVNYVNVKSIYKQKTGNTKKDPNIDEKVTIVMSELSTILKDCEYKIAVKNEQVYLFNGAYWIAHSKDFVRKLFVDISMKSGLNEIECKQHKNINRIHDQALDELVDYNLQKSSDVSINLNNGTVVFDGGNYRLKEFDNKDFFTYRLKFDYNKEADCPRFKEYLHKVLPDVNTQQILQEYSGYIFTKNTAMKLEKVAVLHGSGRNGKSVFFDIISAILGEENKISLSLSDLQQEYYRALITDKLLCYSSEMGKGQDHDMFKKLASGEPITARHKYGKAFTAENYCRFMFNTNELPNKVEHTDAFFRRFLIIPFKVQIKEDEQDLNLASYIIENELPGVFNWILTGLKRLTETKKFTVSKDSTDAINEFKFEQDSVKKFLDQYKIDGVGRKTKFYLNEVYKIYKSFCDEDGYRPVGKKNFSSRVSQQGYDKCRDTDGIYFEENLPF